MYSYFKGKAVEITNNICTIDVKDIGYDIHMCDDEINNIKIGEEIKLFTYFRHREDEMSLFGFIDKSKLNFFKKLIGVSGVGSKVALGIISNISPQDMCSAIATDNILMLKTIPGIGPKMASKIIFELKDKISNDEILKEVPIKVKNNEYANEAITALKVLGYSEKELLECIKGIDIENKSVQDIIKMSLKYMQKN